MEWDREAKEALSRVPFFVRKRVKKRVEAEAARLGADEVKTEHVHACRERFLSRMEEEVRGFQVETCFGSGGCPNRAALPDDLPRELETTVSRRNLKRFLKKKVNGPLKMHHEFRISVSDCPNACSRPQITDIGIIGACKPEVSSETCSECGACEEVCKEQAVLIKDGEPVLDDSRCLYCGQCVNVCPTGTLGAGEQGYRIMVGGKLGRHPRLGTELPGIHDQEGVLRMVDRCLDHYQKHCREGERFGQILERTGTHGLA